MKGSKELKRYMATNRKRLIAYHYDDMTLFKLERSLKRRKKNRILRDAKIPKEELMML